MMIRVLVLLVTMVAVTRGDGPPFCRDIPCPPFTVLETTDDYELREYPATTWIGERFLAPATPRPIGDWMQDTEAKQAYGRIRAYFAGDNAENFILPRTVPIAREQCSQGPCVQYTTISQYLPDIITPPQPNDSRLQIIHKPAQKFYVGIHLGFEKRTQANMQTLTTIKRVAMDEVDPSYHIFLVYGPHQSPVTHNEVWVPALDD